MNRSGNYGKQLAVIVCTASLLSCANSVETFVYSTDAIYGADGYFPLTPGFTSEFKVEQANGLVNLVTFEIGDQVTYQNQTAWEWISQTKGVEDTGYLVQSGDGLYFLDPDEYSREKLLELPLKIGNSWFRFEQTIIDSFPIDDGGDIIVGDGGSGDGQDDQDTVSVFGPQLSYPVTGSNNMSVQAIEEIILKDGSHYSGAVRVHNEGPNGHNFYWYVPKIGLVRYIIGTDAQASDEKGTVGDLISFGVEQ